MKKERLKVLLAAEVAAWADKSFGQLLTELDDVVAYGRDDPEEGFHQFEIMLLERNDEYVHVGVSIDDGSFRRSVSPMTRSFIVHRDGRVEI